MVVATRVSVIASDAPSTTSHFGTIPIGHSTTKNDTARITGWWTT